MKGLGCILDAPEIIAGDLRDHHVAQLVGAERSYAERRDWRDALDFLPDQGASSTCVGWLLSTAIYLAGEVAGFHLPRPSVRWLYALGSWKSAPGKPISAGGRSIRATARAAAAHGIAAEARWPWTPPSDDADQDTWDRFVTEAPPFDLDVAASDAMLTGTYTLGGGDLAVQMRMALDKGHFPGAAINVRDSFDEHRSGLYVPSGASRGWHAICSIAYTPDAICFVRNWGRDDGENGFVWIPDAVLNSPEVADAVVITAAPAGTR